MDPLASTNSLSYAPVPDPARTLTLPGTPAEERPSGSANTHHNVGGPRQIRDEVTIGAAHGPEVEFRPYGPDGRPQSISGNSPQSGEGASAGDERKVSAPGAERRTTAGGKAATTGRSGTGGERDPAVEQEVARLKSAEEKVKAHEAAHKSAGGTIAGPISYTYTRGPDGHSYITGGEVPISVSPGRTPEETAGRMEQVIRAALAPADPSPQDRSVAAQASVQLQEARRQSAEQPPAATGEEATSPGTGAAPETAASGEQRGDGTAIPHAREEKHRPELPAMAGNPPPHAARAVLPDVSTPETSGEITATPVDAAPGPTSAPPAADFRSTLLRRIYGAPPVTGFPPESPARLIALAA